MAEKKEAQKIKRPTAEKRLLQNEKRRSQNKSFLSRIRTAIKKFEKALQAGAEVAVEISGIYSLVDKGLKRGIYKLGKAKRIKSRLMAKAKRSK